MDNEDYIIILHRLADKLRLGLYRNSSGDYLCRSLKLGYCLNNRLCYGFFNNRLFVNNNDYIVINIILSSDFNLRFYFSHTGYYLCSSLILDDNCLGLGNSYCTHNSFLLGRSLFYDRLVNCRKLNVVISYRSFSF